jgi:signal transduction histidine kinase
VLFEKKGLRVETRFEKGMSRIAGDRDRPVQVLTNILSNAVKFTPAGGVVRVVVRRESVPQPQAVVEISDTGIGIPEKDVELILERFHRTDDTHKTGIEGTGLSLAIARDIVEHHGGRIWVVSAEGRGSVFTVTLPLSTEHAVVPEQGWDG